jgi:AP2 domain-containing protein
MAETEGKPAINTPFPASCLVPLTKGLVAIVDEADMPLISAIAWKAEDHAGCRYAAYNEYIGNYRQRKVYMHRLIIGAGKNQRVDHRNGNGLDNRRSNLRIATVGQNAANRAAYSKTGYKGVHVKPSGNFHASISKDKRTIYLGTFPTPEEAARAYDVAAISLHGEFARLNFSRTNDGG